MKATKQLLALAICLIAAAVNANAQTILSPHALALIDDLLAMKVPLYVAPTPQSAVDMIYAWEDSHWADIEQNCTEAEKLVLTNLLYVQRYNYMVQIKGNKKTLINMLGGQAKVAKSYIDSHKNITMDKWLYLSAGSITAVYMALEPLKTAFTYGYFVRDMFQKAVDLDSKFSYAQRNLAQWYYYCPDFLGGGKKKAKTIFQKSYETAISDVDIFEATMLVSQLKYDDKDYATCSSMLDNLEVQFPGNTYIAFVRGINAKGESIFKYHNHKADK